MADEFNLNEATEEATAPKKRGRKSTKVTEAPVEEKTTVKEETTTVEEEKTDAENITIEESVDETSKEDIVESVEIEETHIEISVEESHTDVEDDKQIENEKPLINIENESEAEVFKPFITVTREIVYNLASINAPKRIVSGRITFLEEIKDFCKVLYIAPGRGTDIGYIPKSRYEMYM